MDDTKKLAKKKALSILERMDRTREELIKKLSDCGFEQEDVDDAIAYVTAFGYLDDERYAENFIRSRGQKKSRREIVMLLRQKGLDEDLIMQALEQHYEADSETDTIRMIAKKRGYDGTTASQADRKRLFDYLVRKGFAFESVYSFLRENE